MKWNLPLWFLPCLFASLMVMYGIVRLIMSCMQKACFGLGCILIVFLLFSFSNYYLLGLGKFPFGLENVVCLMPFMLAGYGWKHVEPRLIRFTPAGNAALGCLMVAAGCTLGWRCNTPIDYVSASYGNLFVFYLSAFLAMMGFVFICHAFPMKRIHVLGQHTMCILLIHKFPLVALQMILANHVTLSFSGICIALAVTVIACAFSLLSGKIIGRIFPFALGQHKKSP